MAKVKCSKLRNEPCVFTGVEVQFDADGIGEINDPVLLESILKQPIFQLVEEPAVTQPEAKKPEAPAKAKKAALSEPKASVEGEPSAEAAQ